MKYTNKSFLLLVSLVIIVFGYTAFQSNKQINQKKDDYKLYTEVQTSIETGVSLDKALEKIEKLQKKYNDSYVFNIDKSFIYEAKKEYKNALNELEEAFEKNNSLKNNSGLLLSYAKIANELNDKDTVKKIVLYVEKMNIDGYQKEVLDKLKLEI